MKMAPLGRTTQPGPNDTPRHSAVLALLHRTSESLALVFTRRNAALRHHGGQISFPGGGVEPQDGSHADAALRETEEELGFSTGEVRLLGQMTPLFIAPSQNLVAPFVGWIPELPPLQPDPIEVDEVLTVSVPHLLDRGALGQHVWHRNERELTAPCYQVGQSCIWGATAMMLSELLDIIRSIGA